MAVPVHLNTFFSYKETLAVTDVQTIIDDLRLELITNRLAPNLWTEFVLPVVAGAGNFKSPVRSDGAYFTVTVTKISATRLSFVVKDNLGMLVNNQTDTRLDIATSPGNTVRYFTGPLHFVVDSARTTPECFACGIADQTPEALAIPRPVVWATAGPRSNAGSLTNQTWGNLFCLVPGATSYSTGLGSYTTTRGYNYSTVILQTLTGVLLPLPAELAFYYGSTSAPSWWGGRLHQAVMLDQTQNYGAEFNVPLDGPVTGVFKIVGLTSWGNAVLAFRKATL